MKHINQMKKDLHPWYQNGIVGRENNWWRKIDKKSEEKINEGLAIRNTAFQGLGIGETSGGAGEDNLEDTVG